MSYEQQQLSIDENSCCVDIHQAKLNSESQSEENEYDHY